MANYKGTIIGNGLAESKEKHTPSVHLQIRAEMNLDTKESCDKVFYADLWLSTKAAEKTIDTLRAIGFEGQSIAELNYPCLQGYEVEFTTDLEEYNGEMREKVAFVNAVGSFAKRGVKPIADSNAKSIAAKYDAMFRNKKPTAKASINKMAKRQQPTQQGGIASEDGFTGNSNDDLPWE